MNAFRRWADARKARRQLSLRVSGYLYARRVLACQGEEAIDALRTEADSIDHNAFDDGIVQAIDDYRQQVAL